jgi:hypothetical protein
VEAKKIRKYGLRQKISVGAGKTERKQIKKHSVRNPEREEKGVDEKRTQRK